MKTPSPSIVISTLALAVALTGTAGAAVMINGSQIKPHSITALQLANSSVTTKAIAKKAVTAKAVANHAIQKQALAGDVAVDPTPDPPAVGPAGPAGPTGPAGAPGIIDPSKLMVVAGGDVNLVANGTAVATAACPAGTFVIGGGYTDMGTDQKVYAISSGPAADGSQAWQVRARNDTPTLNQTMLWHAIAYCVAA